MNETTITRPAPLVLGPGEGEEIAAHGTTVRIRAAAPRLTLADHDVPGGFAGPPLHVHPGFDEVFVVVEGTATLRIGDDVHEVGPGGTAFVPGHVPHTFANPRPEPVRFLAVIAPGGFEDCFRAMAEGDDERVAAALAAAGFAPVP